MRPGSSGVGRTSIVARALAVVLPVAILGVTLAVYGRPAPDRISAEAQAFDARFAGSEPNVVILGNSLAGMGVDEAQLAQALGRGVEVAKMTVPQTRPPTWYAVLKHRVFGAGHRPRVVLVVNVMSWLLETKPPSPLAYGTLRDHMRADDQVILDKTFGRAGPAWLQMARQRRTRVRNGLFDGVRNAAIGLLHSPSGAGGPIRRGKLVAEPALARVFGDDAMDLALHKRVISIVEHEEVRGPTEGLSPRASYLPDLADLAREHGAKLIVVRLPLPPSNTGIDRLPAQLVDETIAMMNELGIGYVDLSATDVPETGFRDYVHLNDQGKRMVTEAIAEAMVAWDALGDGPLPPATRNLQAERIERIGEPESLGEVQLERVPGSQCAFTAHPHGILRYRSEVTEALGLGAISPLVVLQDGEPLRQMRGFQPDRGCRGGYVHQGDAVWIQPRLRSPDDVANHRFEVVLSTDTPHVSPRGEAGWWVWPGTTLRFVLPPDDRGRGRVEVAVVAEALGASGAPATLRAGGASASFERAGTRARATLSTRRTGESQAIAIDVPPGGAPLALRGVSLTSDDQTHWLIGGPRSLTSKAARIIGRSSLHPARWRDPPPALRLGEPTEHRGVVTMAVERTPRLDGRTLYERHGYRDCDPVRAVSAGQPLRRMGCIELHATGATGFCYDGERVATRAPHQVQIGLDPLRRCDMGLWVYPGDVLTVRSTALQFAVGADTLELGARALGRKADGDVLELQLLVGGTPVFEDAVAMAELGGTGPVRLSLPVRIPSQTPDVALRVRTADDGPFVVLGVASLLETDPFLPLPMIGQN